MLGVRTLTKCGCSLGSFRLMLLVNMMQQLAKHYAYEILHLMIILPTVLGLQLRRVDV